MISTFIAEHYWAVAFIQIAVSLLCVVAGVVLARAGRPGRRVAGMLGGIGGIGVIGLTLVPDSSPTTEVACFVQLQLGADWSNVVLFFIPTLFVAIALHRPGLTALGGVTLSALIEGLQAIAVAIGRHCDINDWISNSTGSIAAGCTVFVVLAALGRAQSTRDARHASKVV